MSLVAAVDGSVLASLAELKKIAKDLGSTLASPFAILSFLALPVIPELRLTDRELVGVNIFELVR